MHDAACLYAEFLSVLETVLPNDFIASVQNGFPFNAWTKEQRTRLADALSACKELDRQVFDIIVRVLEQW